MVAVGSAATGAPDSGDDQGAHRHADCTVKLQTVSHAFLAGIFGMHIWHARPLRCRCRPDQHKKGICQYGDRGRVQVQAHLGRDLERLELCRESVRPPLSRFLPSRLFAPGSQLAASRLPDSCSYMEIKVREQDDELLATEIAFSLSQRMGSERMEARVGLSLKKCWHRERHYTTGDASGVHFT